MARTRGAEHEDAVAHILNFFIDDHDGCALTVSMREFRFHIMTDPNRIRAHSSKDKTRSDRDRYFSLLKAVKAAMKEEEQAIDQLRKTQENDHDEYRPSSPPRQEDSGYSSGSDEDPEKDCLTKEEQRDPQTALYNWLLEPFEEIYNALPPTPETRQSLHEWYHGPTYFYTLESKHGKIVPKQEDSQPELESRIEALVPRISIPKYIKNLGIPWYHPDDVTVVTATDQPGPYHPSRVQIGDEVHFFKVVDPTQPQPTKRELKIMKEVERKGLHEQIRVPLVKGLIGYGGATSQQIIMGFLQTDIEDPTPLTRMLDSDVVEEKRDTWAREAERMVRVLHDHDIVWGDAKADNFMVDRHGDLWIIDFGGSYTDGWVDPELMETEEGDDMGVEKIVRALEDPEDNTYDPTGEITEAVAGRKRSADETVEGPVVKRQKSSSPLYESEIDI
ncbi:hypothetical protein F4778DRAFT_763459 [Xylariomycetidae sp. FL2044]|nr:hypothetical protein F4778DRAFT_763459 [Xylariomycetidae sp. FL2044]